MIKRNIESKILNALKDTPVIFINGARQTGKSTLVKKIGDGLKGFTYFTMDDASVLSSARSDPAGFVKKSSGTIAIDEVQKAPGLLPAIKLAVDNDRRPGAFILTGSADILLLPELSESLAGRMEIITMYPFSQGELEGKEDRFVDALFSGSPPALAPALETGRATNDRVLSGGFPEAFSRTAEDRRHAWYGSYLSTVIQRDIRDIARIEGMTEMPRLLAALAARTGSLLNLADLSRGFGISHTTLKRYLAFLEMAFLVKRIPAWSANLVKRLVKAPKPYLCDTGLAAHLSGVSAGRLAAEPMVRGQLYENFVGMELAKQASWAALPGISLFHYRSIDGKEIDFILEDPAGRIAAVEVKSSATVGPEDFRMLKQLALAAGQNFIQGVVLYAGDATLPFGERLSSAPISTLWQS